jgi:hypothetical protein
MRSFLRLQACVAAVLVTIVYFFYQHHSIGFESAIHTALHGTEHRLVLFGDDWSDTGTYRALPPPYSETAVRDPARGELWAETLCNEVSHCLVQESER